MQITQNGRPMKLGKYCVGVKLFAGYCPECKAKTYMHTTDVEEFLKNAGYSDRQKERNPVLTHLIANLIPDSVRDELIHRDFHRQSLKNKQNYINNEGIFDRG